MGIKVRKANGSEHHFKGDVVTNVDSHGNLVVCDKEAGAQLAVYPQGKWMRMADERVDLDGPVLVG